MSDERIVEAITDSTRVVIETPCEHDYIAEHTISFIDGTRCPGGSRRVLSVEAALREKE